MIVVEKIKIGLTAIFRLLFVFLFYNLTLICGFAVGGAIGFGSILIMEKAFLYWNPTNTASTVLLEGLSNLFNWAIMHPAVSITFLIGGYVVGFFVYICGFAKNMRMNLILGQ